MVHLDDLDVEVLPERARRARTSRASRLTPRLMLPERTIGAWRAAAAIWARSASVRPVVPTTWAMRAWAASAADSTLAAGAEKSTIPSASSHRRQRVVADHDPARADAGEQAGVRAERRRALAFDRGGERHARCLGDRLDQHPSHAPGGAGDDQPHVGHCALLDPSPEAG